MATPVTITITDLGNDIQFALSDGKVVTFNKISMRVKQVKTGEIYVTNGDGFISSALNEVIKLDHNIVSSPSYASNALLFAGIKGMISSVSLGGGGGVGGGGNNTWSTLQGDFSASVTASTKNITVTGLPFTLEDGHVALGSIKKIDSSGEVTSLDVSNVSVSGNVITLSGIDDFVATDTVEVILFGLDKAYDQSLDAGKQFIINPEYEHYTSPEKLVDTEDVADGTTERYIIPFEGYKYLSMHARLYTNSGDDEITVTFWATNDGDADDSADTNWVDISSDVLGGASVSATGAATTEEGIYFIDVPTVALKFMVKVVYAAGGTPDNKTEIYIKKSS